MSFLDKLVSVVAPPESDEERMKARQHAREMSGGRGWMSDAIDHHDQIESLLTEALNATGEAQARSATKELAILLTAHSVAEENVLYPTMVIEGHKVHAAAAYQEQQMAKIQMAELERLMPLSDDWRDKLGHIQGAVLHHIYEEEKNWFPEILSEAAASDQNVLDARFTEEFERLMGGVKAPI